MRNCALTNLGWFGGNYLRFDDKDHTAELLNSGPARPVPLRVPARHGSGVRHLFVCSFLAVADMDRIDFVL